MYTLSMNPVEQRLFIRPAKSNPTLVTAIA